MCTLDFPWGHVRLSAVEFDDYLRTHRPHERENALDFYTNQFQTPRLTIGRMESFIIESGFEIKNWRESRSTYQDHYAFCNEGLLAECKEHFPDVTVRDLLTNGYSTVLRKR